MQSICSSEDNKKELSYAFQVESQYRDSSLLKKSKPEYW